jgi:hypothetical protein
MTFRSIGVCRTPQSCKAMKIGNPERFMPPMSLFLLALCGIKGTSASKIVATSIDSAEQVVPGFRMLKKGKKKSKAPVKKPSKKPSRKPSQKPSGCAANCVANQSDFEDLFIGVLQDKVINICEGATIDVTLDSTSSVASLTENPRPGGRSVNPLEITADANTCPTYKYTINCCGGKSNCRFHFQDPDYTWVYGFTGNAYAVDFSLNGITMSSVSELDSFWKFPVSTEECASSVSGSFKTLEQVIHPFLFSAD